MEQTKDISNNALCAGVKTPVVRQPLLTQVASAIEFLIQFFSSLIISRVIQNKAEYEVWNR
jgi:hypothetical protein